MTLFLTLLHAGLLVLIGANWWYLRLAKRASLANTRVPRLSVLIPARNEEDNLKRLLPSLAAQDYPDLEVIVYDDASEDRTWEVIQHYGDGRVRGVRGTGPPEGWMGKPHALYQATRQATGERYLFLDADAELLQTDALRRLMALHEGMPQPGVMTGLPRLKGSGKLLVSLVPNAILVGLPWPLVRYIPLPALGAVNGQCWMLAAEPYHRLEPHREAKGEILEDVMIGRYLKRNGVVPYLRDVQSELAVYMYRSFGDAWRGFRKNAYLILGGAPASFALMFAIFGLTFVVTPLFGWWLLLSIYAFKVATDRISGFSWTLSILAPLSYTLGWVLQLDSAVSHWLHRVSWKGRRVEQRPIDSQAS